MCACTRTWNGSVALAASGSHYHSSSVKWKWYNIGHVCPEAAGSPRAENMAGQNCFLPKGSKPMDETHATCTQVAQIHSVNATAPSLLWLMKTG